MLVDEMKRADSSGNILPPLELSAATEKLLEGWRAICKGGYLMPYRLTLSPLPSFVPLEEVSALRLTP
jgi:hypothetical protein